MLINQLDGIRWLDTHPRLRATSRSTTSWFDVINHEEEEQDEDENITFIQFHYWNFLLGNFLFPSNVRSVVWGILLWLHSSSYFFMLLDRVDVLFHANINLKSINSRKIRKNLKENLHISISFWMVLSNNQIVT